MSQHLAYLTPHKSGLIGSCWNYTGPMLKAEIGDEVIITTGVGIDLVGRVDTVEGDQMAGVIVRLQRQARLTPSDP